MKEIRMKLTSKTYTEYLAILREELIPAEGCTEPIAVAYAAAKARDVLAEPVQRCTLIVSGPIIKNVKSVVVPHTGGQKGLKIAIAAGLLGGDANAVLQVLSKVTSEQQAALQGFIEEHTIEIIPAVNDIPFYIDLRLEGASHHARILIQDAHTNILLLQRDEETVWSQTQMVSHGHLTDRSCLNVADILTFANTVRMNDIQEVIGRLISFNSAISNEGLEEHWGAEIGKTLLETYGEGVPIQARAAAAAGSDARMSGCELPVVIVSGSGNQGITCSMPVITYAKHLGSTREQLFRALTLAALVTVHQKTRIGPVSAFCGAVCAGVGAGCGVAYLQEADIVAINHTIVNALAICSGMVCDGAKPSCAAKISAAVDAGLLGYNMYMRNQQFRDGEGIVKDSVEHTIEAVCDMAHDGMRQTDKRILEIMLKN
jgi:L-cysteine desulfidase